MKSSQKNAWISIAGVLCILLIGILLFRIDVILLLILSMIYLAIVGRSQGMSLSDFIQGMKDGCSQAFIGLLFFLLIGALIGIWMQAGTVPALVYYGLDILSPRYFLVSSFVICAIVSTVIGTSWGTVGTVGIAIMSIATASGIQIPLSVIAGSIVSGSWFGDKMSPISDSTVLAATACGTDIYKHIRSMCYTTLPASLITLVLFFMVNQYYAQAVVLNQEAIEPLKATLNELYQINIWVLIPPVLLVILCVLKIDAVVSLLSAIGAGILVSILIQKNTITLAFDAVMNGVSIETSVEAVNVLLNRGGIYSMMPTFLLGFTALCLGGALEKTHALHVILESITKNTKSVVALVFTTMVSCFMGNAVFGDTYLTLVLNANLYRDIYEEKGLDLSILSRTIEEATTMSTPLIPWTAASAFVVGALGIPTLEYLPFVFLNLTIPAVSLLFAFFGIGIMRKVPADEAKSK